MTQGAGRAATTPLWLADEVRPRAALASDAEADVCIVGAGVGGLSTAWHLAGHGLRVVVLEARTAGAGASGRNGGFLLAGAAAFYHDLRRRQGRDDARRLYRLTLEAQDAIHVLAAEIGASAHLRRAGGLRLSADAAEAADIRLQAAALADDGFAVDLVGAPDLPRALRAPGRIGLLTAADGGMHPGRWIQALAAAVVCRGVPIYEGTPVEAPVLRPDGAVVVTTPRGDVRTPIVVVAADGALPALVPCLAGHVRPRRLHMVATAPADPVLGPETIYTRYGLEYAQQTSEGRVALGGFSDLDGPRSFTDREEAAPDVHDRLERWLREELRLTAPVTHRWVGVVGYSNDGLPFVGRVPERDDLLVLGGYSGTGNVVGFLAGRIVAELILTGQSPDADLFDPRRAMPRMPADARSETSAHDGARSSSSSLR